MIEPVSSSKFPANREINREFCEIRPLPCHFDVQTASEFNGFRPNSLRNGTGNFWRRYRELFSKNREFWNRNHESTPRVSGFHDRASSDRKLLEADFPLREIDLLCWDLNVLIDCPIAISDHVVCATLRIAEFRPADLLYDVVKSSRCAGAQEVE